MGVGAGGGRPREIFERLGLIYAIFKIKIVISSLDELFIFEWFVQIKAF